MAPADPDPAPVGVDLENVANDEKEPNMNRRINPGPSTPLIPPASFEEPTTTIHESSNAPSLEQTAQIPQFVRGFVL